MGRAASRSGVTDVEGRNTRIRQGIPEQAVLTEAERQRFAKARIAAVKKSLDLPLVGITSDGVSPDRELFHATTGSSVELIRSAGVRLMDYFATQAGVIQYESNSRHWKRWSSRFDTGLRHGVCLEDMDPERRQAALDVVAASTSQAGFDSIRNAMRLNGTAAELTGRFSEFGEWKYWFSTFGSPADGGPWGWQLDGHHVVINCAIAGDRVVMTPMFLGAEPVQAYSGTYEGLRVLEAEQDSALALAQSLSHGAFDAALGSPDLPRDVFSVAQMDNLVLPHRGLRADSLNDRQADALRALIGVYVGRATTGQARTWMSEIEQNLDETWILWRGSREDLGVFYYRIHSPVVLIEFLHRPGIIYNRDDHFRNHIHSIVRTPNGNDYGWHLREAARSSTNN